MEIKKKVFSHNSSYPPYTNFFYNKNLQIYCSRERSTHNNQDESAKNFQGHATCNENRDFSQNGISVVWNSPTIAVPEALY